MEEKLHKILVTVGLIVAPMLALKVNAPEAMAALGVVVNLYWLWET